MTSNLSPNVSVARDIPVTRRAEPGTPLPADYSTTPHGTIFSTTPGGTKIIYDRNTLLQLRNSPLARTPPTNLPFIPGVTRASVGSTTGTSHLQHSFTPASLLETTNESSEEEEEEAEDHTNEEHHKDTDMFDMELE
ncbi:Eukaryotic translation initiation factor 4E-binding protein 2 [Basidiobolus ranarum]|uniref:Eukaryotic translation initiation factor 4E-binding protein 2 n=1 Tax=Basidiobolus ranarum TaxID=34480 RepID=A0ABR2X035_9FUNG